jgi:hypothetical protein
VSDLHWTVSKLQQMLAEYNAAECDASKRDAEHALCRIANESLVHDLTRVMDERDRLQAEVERLQGEVRQAQTGHDCALVAAYESGLRAGQEAMRERAAEVCGMRHQEHWSRVLVAHDGYAHDRAEGMADEAEECADAIRALEVPRGSA